MLGLETRDQVAGVPAAGAGLTLAEVERIDSHEALAGPP